MSPADLRKTAPESKADQPLNPKKLSLHTAEPIVLQPWSLSLNVLSLLSLFLFFAKVCFNQTYNFLSNF